MIEEKPRRTEIYHAVRGAGTQEELSVMQLRIYGVNLVLSLVIPKQAECEDLQGTIDKAVI